MFVVRVEGWSAPQAGQPVAMIHVFREVLQLGLKDGKALLDRFSEDRGKLRIELESRDTADELMRRLIEIGLNVVLAEEPNTQDES